AGPEGKKATRQVAHHHCSRCHSTVPADVWSCRRGGRWLGGWRRRAGGPHLGQPGGAPSGGRGGGAGGTGPSGGGAAGSSPSGPARAWRWGKVTGWSCSAAANMRSKASLAAASHCCRSCSRSGLGGGVVGVMGASRQGETVGASFGSTHATTPGDA